jgi:hypothetical protein
MVLGPRCYPDARRIEPVRFDAEHPLNALFVASQQGKGAGTVDVLEPPDSKPSAYRRGSHPDVVDHLWKKLGNKLPVDCRAILFGSPVLIEPSSGVMIAKAFGTAYVIRVSPDDLEAALSLGCTTTHQWSDGKTTDLQQELGVDWVFGHWLKQEYKWIQRTFTMVAAEPS